MNKLGIILIVAAIACVPATVAYGDEEATDERSQTGTLFDCCETGRSDCDPRLGVECRGCGQVTGADVVLAKGLCLCRDDRTLCSDERGGVCVSLTQDPNHCGACDTACSEGKVCADGACTTPCQPMDVASVLRASCEELMPGDGPCTQFHVDAGAGRFNCTEDPALPGSCIEGEVCALAPDKPGCQVIFENRTTGSIGGARTAVRLCGPRPNPRREL